MDRIQVHACTNEYKRNNQCFSASSDHQLHGETWSTPQTCGGYQRAWHLRICHRVGEFPVSRICFVFFWAFSSTNLFQEQGQDHNQQTGRFSLSLSFSIRPLRLCTVFSLISLQEKKLIPMATQVGHMLRTKLSHVNEGGVAAGSQSIESNPIHEKPFFKSWILTDCRLSTKP